MSSDLALLSATELVEKYRGRALSPVEVTQAALARIATLNPRLNAFCLIDEEKALEAARRSEQRWMQEEPCGLVDGVPVSVKDLLVTKGWPTLRGSRAVGLNQPWEEDAPTVASLRRHGAVLLGKTTTPEFGWKGVTDSPRTGITRNPWNPDLTPGGSSGGAAVAAATGMGALHLGTDGGGSIRIPASFTGIFGFKQTYGRVPAYPLSPFGTLAHVGPMTRTVGDAALMLTVITEPDPRDWYALPPDRHDYRRDLAGGVRGLRIAFSPTLGGQKVQPEVEAIVAGAAATFRQLGATVEEADPRLGDLHEVFLKHWQAGAANALRAFTPEQRRVMEPGLVGMAEEGARLSLLDYLAAVKEREMAGVKMNAFHQRWDLLLTPTMPLTAFAVGQEAPIADGSTRWVNWTPFTYPFNLTRQPAASVPCGFTAAGMPVGLQIVGPLYEDARVLRAARAYEAVHPFKMPAV